MLAYAWRQPDQKVSNRPFYTRLHPAADIEPLKVRLSGLRKGRYQLRMRRVGYQRNDAYSAYIEMGSPSALMPAQLQALQALTQDRPEIDRVLHVSDGAVVDLPMRANDVVLIELRPAA